MTAMPARYREGRRAAIAAGTWQPWTDGDAAREHLARCRATGATFENIGAVTQLSPDTVEMVGRSAGRLRTATAMAILSVDPAALDPAWYDAGGTRLRLRALAALGWTLPDIGAAAGTRWQRLRDIRAGKSSLVDRRVRAAVIAAYEELWDQQPEPSRGATLARTCAREGRWLMPADLDDDLFDVPGYAPRRRPLRTGAPAGEQDPAVRGQESATEETAA